MHIMNTSTDSVEPVKKKIKASERPHYVNNAEFSQAIVDHATSIKKAKSAGKPIPQLSEYIGSCLLKIAEGLSRKPNFVRYTYREDMVMDAVENCLRAVSNFNVNAGTRTGLPNAFAYFTQICYFAFIRRIQKEKKCQDVKLLYMENAGIENFANFGEDNIESPMVGEGIVERVRHKAEQIHRRDQAIKAFGKQLKKKKKTSKKNSPNTLEFLM
jgi:hypothetical protein